MARLESDSARRLAGLLLCLFLALAPRVEARTCKIYWTGFHVMAGSPPSFSGGIWRADPDGGNTEMLVSHPLPTGITLVRESLVVEWMYWGAIGGIWKARPDGTDVARILTLTDLPLGIAIDANGQKVYWADSQGVNRANLDGTGIERVARVLGASTAWDVDLDVAGRAVYWTEPEAGIIARAPIDGTLPGRPRGVVAGGRPAGLALNPVGGKLYWVDASTGFIGVANLDGSNAKKLVYGSASQNNGIALDVHQGSVERIYWTASGLAFTSPSIRRALGDGSGVEQFQTFTHPPAGIALDLPPRPTPFSIRWFLIRLGLGCAR